MRISLAKIIALLLITSAMPASAQLVLYPFDSLYTTNFLRTNFSNDINVSNLYTLLNYNATAGRFGVILTDHFQSNISKLERNYSRDFNNFKGVIYYRLTERLNAGGGFQNIFLTDDKNIESDRNNSSFVFSNFDYIPVPAIISNLRLGYKRDDQIGEINSGLSGILRAKGNNFLISDYLSNGELTLAYEDLGGKMSHLYDLNATVSKVFSAAADNTGTIHFYNSSNDFFFPASFSVANEYGVKNNSERRSENFIQIGDALNYRLNKYSGLALAGNFYNRIVKREYRYKATASNALLDNLYDNEINESNLEISAQADLSIDRIYALARMFYIERSENHSLLNISGLTQAQVSELERAERNKNNNSRRTGMLGDIRFDLSNTNFVSAVGSASLLRYDTEYSENYDDRDETETNIYLLHGFTNLRNFDIQTKFDYIYSTLSYLYSQRSANNYDNTIYRLSSVSNFRPSKNLLTRNFFQVLANYTVYDFEDIVSQVQSFSYRQLSVRDSTSYYFHPRFEFLFLGELRFYEQGEFDNDDFTVNPINYFEEYFFSPEIVYSPPGFMKALAGFRFFQQKRYSYEDGERFLNATYKSLGPYGKIFIYLNNESIINFTAGLDFISNSIGDFSDESLNLTLNLLWNI